MMVNYEQVKEDFERKDARITLLEKEVSLLKEKPVHPDIELYGYQLSYDIDSGDWYANDEDHWHKWDGSEFVQMFRTDSSRPKHLTAF